MILIYGGNGFIGNFIVSELNKHKALFEGMNIARKKLVFEPEQESSLLDEKNIKDIQ